MAEIFDFEKAREKRDNPKGLEVGDRCYILDYNKNTHHHHKVIIKSIDGKNADIEMVNNPDGFIFMLLPDNQTFEMNYINNKAQLPLSFLLKV
jgi:hypothetical protein